MYQRTGYIVNGRIVFGSGAEWSPPAHAIPSHLLPVHSSYNDFYRMWITARDCNDGEYKVKARRQIYLRKLPTQSDSEYDAYLARATYFNAVGITAKGLLGSLYRLPPEISVHKKTPSGVSSATALTEEELAKETRLISRISFDSITKDGHSLINLSKIVSRDVILCGRAGALVDLPAEPSTTPKPFIVEYGPESIINWRFRQINSKIVLDQIVLVENEEQTQAIGVTDKLIYRVLGLDENGDYFQQVYVPSPTSNSLESVELRELIYPTVLGEKLKFIPFVFFGAMVNSADCNTLPLKDIISLNLSQYRSYAELEHGRFFCAMPTYYIKGGGLNPVEAASGGKETETPGQTTPFAIGPNNLWLLGQEDDAGILEFNGSGLSYLENAIEQKQNQMAAAGSKLLVQQRKQAATSNVSIELANMGEQATLSDIAFNLDQGFDQLLKYMVMFAGLGEDYQICLKMNKDFEPADITAREMRAIQQLYEGGLLNIDLIYQTFRDAGIVKSSVDKKEFEEMIKQRIEEKNAESLKTQEDQMRLNKKYNPTPSPSTTKKPVKS